MIKFLDNHAQLFGDNAWYRTVVLSQIFLQIHKSLNTTQQEESSTIGIIIQKGKKNDAGQQQTSNNTQQEESSTIGITFQKGKNIM